MIPDFDAAGELAFALKLADLATAISLPHYVNRTFNLDWKANRTEVTEADREAEFDPATTKAEASKLIDRLRQETGRSG